MMKFGLKVHHTDVDMLLGLYPEALEYVLLENDLSGGWGKPPHYDGPIVVHAPEKYMDGRLLDLASEEETHRRRAIELLKRAIDVSAKLGASSLVCHPGGIYITQREVDTIWLIESMQELSDHNAGRVDLLLENMPGIYWNDGSQWTANVFNDWKQIRDILKEIDMGMCLDVCHARLFCTSKGIDFISYIKVLKPFVRHIHIADALGDAGEGIQIGDGELDFKAVLSSLKGLDVIAVPEILNGHKDGGAGFKIARNRLARMGWYSQQAFEPSGHSAISE